VASEQTSTEEAVVLSQVVWEWLEAHWHVVSVIGSVAVAVLLLATAALPPLLAPLVLGPLAAVIVTALITPTRKVADRSYTRRREYTEPR
jgi:hypothetical protein